MLRIKLNEDLERSYLFYFKNDKFYEDESCLNWLRLSDDDPSVHLLRYYINYAEKTQAPSHNEYIVFDPSNPADIYFRYIRFSQLESGFFCISVESKRPLEESMLYGSFRIFENLSDAIVITNSGSTGKTDQRIIYANPAYLAGSQYKLADILGRSPKILQAEGTEFSARKSIREKIVSWQPVQQKITNYRLDGSSFVVELNMNPVKDITGWWTHWISTQKDISKRVYAAEGIEVQFFRSHHHEKIFALGIESELQQALMNLISHAKDAASVSTLPIIRVSCWVGGDGGSFIAVEDNGPGVSQENHNKIFDTFFSTKDIGKGAGVGLSIAKQIVSSFGGGIKVLGSNLGGAKFVISLPNSRHSNVA